MKIILEYYRPFEIRRLGERQYEIIVFCNPVPLELSDGRTVHKVNAFASEAFIAESKDSAMQYAKLNFGKIVSCHAKGS